MLQFSAWSFKNVSMSASRLRPYKSFLLRRVVLLILNLIIYFRLRLFKKLNNNNNNQSVTVRMFTLQSQKEKKNSKLIHF